MKQLLRVHKDERRVALQEKEDLHEALRRERKARSLDVERLEAKIDGKNKELAGLQKIHAAESSTEENRTEIDDLLMILGDLEEKRIRDKVCPLHSFDQIIC